MKIRTIAAIAAIAALPLALPVAANASEAVAAETAPTIRVSIADDGAQGNGDAVFSDISADGRYVVYSTEATNMMPGNRWGYDVIRYDRVEKTSTRVAVSDDGSFSKSGPANVAISGDGRYVAFDSIDRLFPDQVDEAANIYLWDATTGKYIRITNAANGGPANHGSWHPDVSGDGRYVTYQSMASDLVPGDHNPGFDVFVYDQQTKTTERVSDAPAGAKGGGVAAAISADGRFVTFAGSDTLVDGDTNGKGDVVVYDRTTKETTRASVLSDGTQGNGSSGDPAISATGRYITYVTNATNLVPGDTNGAPDVLRYDRQTGETTRVSVAADGGELTGAYEPTITADGRLIAYVSADAVAGDTNAVSDVFVYDVETGRTERVSVATDGTEASDGSGFSSISANGEFVSFAAADGNLVPDDTNEMKDIFLAPARRTPATS